jgi:hypothetical protein
MHFPYRQLSYSLLFIFIYEIVQRKLNWFCYREVDGCRKQLKPKTCVFKEKTMDSGHLVLVLVCF